MKVTIRNGTHGNANAHYVYDDTGAQIATYLSAWDRLRMYSIWRNGRRYHARKSFDSLTEMCSHYGWTLADEGQKRKDPKMQKTQVTAGTTTHRRVAHRMGEWKWGYPKGERWAIVRYVARPDAQGKLRWYSDLEVCSGLTAANEGRYRAAYPDAFAASTGSIHRQLVEDQ